MSSHFFSKLIDNVLLTSMKTFGELVEYRPQKGGRYNVKVVFDRAYEQVNPETQVAVSINSPRLGVRLKDIPNVPLVDDQVRHNQEFFKVTEIREDGQGGAYIYLVKLIDE